MAGTEEVAAGAVPASGASEGEESGFDMDAAVDELSASLADSGDITLPPEEKGEGDQNAAQPPLEGEGQETGEPAAAAPAATAAPTAATRAPDTWTKEAQAVWATVPPVAQAEIAKREGDIARYVNETRGQVSVAEGFAKLLEPYQQLFAHYNVNAWQHVASLLHGHATLMFGQPEQKIQLAMSLMQDAGLDPQKLAAGDYQNAMRAPNRDVQAVLQRIANMEQGITGVTSQLNAQRVAELDAQVAAFAEDAAHPHFYEVYQEIAQLLDRGVCKTLDEAYDKAVWGNPAIRAREQERMAQEAAKKRTDEGARKLAGSRRAAAVNVRGQGTGSGAAPAGNWEDSLTGTLQEIRARG